MPSLPTVGGSNNTWGTELNSYLSVSLASDGTMKDGVSYGTNPASAGTLRLPNAGWIAARNAANGADVNLVRLNSSNELQLGDGATIVAGAFSPSGGNAQLFSQKNYTGNQTGNQHTAYFYSQAVGTRDTSHFLYNVLSQIQEPNANQKTVSGAADNGSGLVRLTVTSHGYATGDRIVVDSVGGVPAADGTWIVTVINSSTLDLQGSAFSGSYTTGGITTNRAGYAAYLALVAPSVARGGLTGANLHADDVCGFFVSNNGTAKATDAFYVGRNASVATEWDSYASYDGAATYGLLVNNVVGSGTPVVRGTGYSATAAPEFQTRMARGTYEAPRRTKSGDILGRFSGVPFVAADDSSDATASAVTARMDFVASEDQTASAQGSRIVFYNIATGSNSPAERGRFQGGDGLDFNAGTFSTFQLRLKNNTWVVARNAVGNANVNIVQLDSSNLLKFGGGNAVAILATGGGATVDNVITHLQNLGLARQS